MKRVLIIKLWALGDILMATPLLTALKSQYPECEITWVAESSHADILLGHPLINELIRFDSGKWRRLLRKGLLWSWWKEARHHNSEMRQRDFDAVVNCHPEKWWTRIFCAAPVRIGLFPSERLPLMQRLYTMSLAKPPRLHNTDNYLRALEALGLTGPFDRHMALHLSPEEREAARDFLLGEPGYRPSLPMIILHPGTSQPSKCWPVESFAALAGMLPEYNIVLTGSWREQNLAQAVSAGMPEEDRRPLIAAGRLSIKAAADRKSVV